jgi:hypothetical protein
MFAFALVNVSAWLFIIPATLIFNRTSEAWIWESIPKEGKKRLRKIWARNAREQGSEDSVVMGDLGDFSLDDASVWDAGGEVNTTESE